MLAMYDKASRHYYRGNATPGPGARHALQFTSGDEVSAELHVLAALGLWPLYHWRQVNLPVTSRGKK